MLNASAVPPSLFIKTPLNNEFTGPHPIKMFVQVIDGGLCGDCKVLDWIDCEGLSSLRKTNHALNVIISLSTLLDVKEQLQSR